VDERCAQNCSNVFFHKNQCCICIIDIQSIQLLYGIEDYFFSNPFKELSDCTVLIICRHLRFRCNIVVDEVCGDRVPRDHFSLYNRLEQQTLNLYYFPIILRAILYRVSTLLCGLEEIFIIKSRWT
jgi:hypothetical protein